MTKLAEQLKTKIDKKLVEYIGKPIVRETILGMQNVIKSEVTEMFSGTKLSAEAVSWLTNNLLREVRTNDSDGEFSIGEVILFNDYELSEIKYSDVVLLESIFRDASFGVQLTQYVNKRLS